MSKQRMLIIKEEKRDKQSGETCTFQDTENHKEEERFLFWLVVHFLFPAHKAKPS